jgi:hypothetical protein
MEVADYAPCSGTVALEYLKKSGPAGDWTSHILTGGNIISISGVVSPQVPATIDRTPFSSTLTLTLTPGAAGERRRHRRGGDPESVVLGPAVTVLALTTMGGQHSPDCGGPLPGLIADQQARFAAGQLAFGSDESAPAGSSTPGSTRWPTSAGR